MILLLLALNIGQVKQDISCSNYRDTVMIQNYTVKEFKDCLAEIESRGHSHTVVNKYGYMGKYQISNWLLNRFSKLTKEEFLKSRLAQEHLMNRLLIFYLSEIQRLGWDSYIGVEIGGITVTLEGLMAGFHQHPVALKKWLESCGTVDKTDGFGTPVSAFIKKFDNTNGTRISQK